MSLKQLFLVTSILVAFVRTGPVRKGKNCTCTLYHHQFCGNGECYFTKDCIEFGCSCFKGWMGENCDIECKRNCNEGVCYVSANVEHCSCPMGFTSSSNCTELQTVSPPTIKNPETDDRWLIFFVAVPVTMLCSLAMVLYKLWKRRVLFAMRIVHYFHWQSHDDNKEYDAFVSFRSCTSDEPWVLNTLFPKLEKEMGFRLCIHLRDFPAGELISNNIIDAIEKSRRTILVISPDYVTSEWTRMEYQVAQQEMLRLRHQIIPIMFRDVSDANSIDKCLKFILRTVTYIKWPGDTDTKGQRRFWEQLKLTMPKMMTLQTENPEPNNADLWSECLQSFTCNSSITTSVGLTFTTWDPKNQTIKRPR